MLTSIDLNSDMGERDNAEGLATDAEMMLFITSVNIACGGHAGSPALMRRTAQLAARHGVAIGAHPGFPDREQFGRTEQPLSPHAIITLVMEQLHTLMNVLALDHLALAHVKPHGALYNMATQDRDAAQAIVKAVQAVDPRLRLYALAGSVLAEEGQAAGLTVVNEAFVDRAYRADGTLASRSERGAVLTDDHAVRQQLHQLISGSVTSIDGATLPIRADSFCLHSDTPGAAPLARMIRRECESAGLRIAAVRPDHA